MASNTETLELLHSLFGGKPEPLTKVPPPSGYVFNLEMANWAENKVKEAFNSKWDSEFQLVHYGENYDVMGGSDEFDKEIFDNIQKERMRIGKKPDFLLFHSSDLPDDFSGFDGEEQAFVDGLVSKAVGAIEVKSSRMDEGTMKRRAEKKRIQITEMLGEKFGENPPGVADTNFEGAERDEYKKIKNPWGKMAKPLNFTITKKDLTEFYFWIEKYEVRLYYVQCLYDRMYIISIGKILRILNDESEKGELWDFEKKKSGQEAQWRVRLSEGDLLGEIAPKPDLKVKKVDIGLDGKVTPKIEWTNGGVILQDDTLDSIFK